MLQRVDLVPKLQRRKVGVLFHGSRVFFFNIFNATQRATDRHPRYTAPAAYFFKQDRNSTPWRRTSRRVDDTTFHGSRG